jgi:polygalacturonase
VKPFRRLWIAFLVLALACCVFTFNPSGAANPLVQKSAPFSGAFDVRKFGAKGDGKALDSPAINKAIAAAAAAGGGTVLFTAGTYRSFSIRLKSNVALYLDQGATILAAHPNDGDGKYDLPEPNSWDQYQDFGHSHWHNSLIWGENLENVSILGPGRIWGKGLVRSGSQSRTKEQNDALEKQGPDPKAGPWGYPNARDAVEQRHHSRHQHPARRTLRDPRHGRRQSHHRQRQDRHKPRRHRCRCV